MNHETGPKVGIFWLNTEKGELFDVESIPVSQLSPGKNSIGKRHGVVWEQKFFGALNCNDTNPIYLTDFSLIPRGEICFDPASNEFIAKVWNWIHDLEPMLNPLIQKEFGLQKFAYRIESHLGIAQSWPPPRHRPLTLSPINLMTLHYYGKC